MATLSNTAATARTGVFVSVGFFLASAWITLSLRLWVRTVMVKRFSWDDALLLFSALVFTGFCVVVLLIETVGGAHHIQQLSFPQLERLFSMVVSLFGLYIFTMVFLKLSLGIFYLRLVIRPWHRWLVHGTLFLNTTYGVVLFFIATFNCGDPTQYLLHELQGICLPDDKIYGIQLTGGIINAITDCILAVLPVFILAKATMPMLAKVGAGFVLLLGCSGSLISLIRLQYLKGLSRGENFFNTAIPLCIWSTAECGLGISAASSAALQPLFRSVVEQTRNASLFQSMRTGGSREDSVTNSENHGRQTDTMFGQWQRIPLRHESTHFSSKDEAHISMTPIPNKPRALSKRGVSGEVTSVRPHIDRSVTANSGGTLRPQAYRMKSMTSNYNGDRWNSKEDVGAMARVASVRDKPISRPIPHIIDQMTPPTPTFGERSQQLVRIDPRRRGSPDWMRDVNHGYYPNNVQSAFLAPPSTTRSYFDGRPF